MNTRQAFSENEFLNDKTFLLKLDNDRNRRVFVKITVLDRDELPIRDIEGQITVGGNLNIDGSSAMRRTSSISFVAEEKDNDLEDIDNLLSLNKRIRLYIGLENNVDDKYEKVIWFNQGVFVIEAPALSHSPSSVNINLNLKDKMCLLNGSAGGTLPTSVTFDSYDQYDDKGNLKTVKQKFYDIIRTAVINYGGEGADNVLVEDVPLQIKQIVHWTGSNPLYFNPKNAQYKLEIPAGENPDDWTTFKYNDEVGYIYTDFIFPKELKTGFNASVSAGVLDPILGYLGNHEYFYDVEGRFTFREKKNYLNSFYDPTINTRLDNGGRDVPLLDNGLSVIDNTNYQVDFTGNSKYAYVFSENNSIVSMYSNSPSYSNIKNDFHIWGKNKDRVIHYHLALKRKPRPSEFGTYDVVNVKDKNNNDTGQIRIATPKEIADKVSYKYKPDDWRAELYLQGLSAKMKQIRPDIYQQELIDLFDTIYDMKNKKFKIVVENPNELNYFFDYLEPTGKLQDYSVDNIGTRIYTMQQNNINKIYDKNIPNYCLIDIGLSEEEKIKEQRKCLDNGNLYSQVATEIYKDLGMGAVGYTAQETARNLLNQYTHYNEVINIQCVPIYYLEPNTRIKVDDRASNIHGDFMIRSISLPIGARQMNISAVRIKGLAETLGESNIDYMPINEQTSNI